MNWPQMSRKRGATYLFFLGIFAVIFSGHDWRGIFAGCVVVAMSFVLLNMKGE